MKIQTVILAFTLASFAAIADETIGVTGAPQFREGKGQLYNTDMSKKFENFRGTVIDVLTNGVVLEAKRSVPHDSGGFYSKIDVIYTIGSEDILATNFAMDLQPTTGSNQRGRAMRVGTINYNGQVLKP